MSEFIPADIAAMLKPVKIALGFDKKAMDYYMGYENIDENTNVVFICEKCGHITEPKEAKWIKACNCDNRFLTICSEQILEMYFHYCRNKHFDHLAKYCEWEDLKQEAEEEGVEFYGAEPKEKPTLTIPQWLSGFQELTAYSLI